MRAELNPMLLTSWGRHRTQLRPRFRTANANSPKGEFTGPVNAWTIDANDQLFKAEEYRNLIVASNQTASSGWEMSLTSRTRSKTSAMRAVRTGSPLSCWSSSANPAPTSFLPSTTLGN